MIHNFDEETAQSLEAPDKLIGGGVSAEHRAIL
jgi:hypothetical protein